jgi:hypothetical protein
LLAWLARPVLAWLARPVLAWLARPVLAWLARAMLARFIAHVARPSASTMVRRSYNSVA